MASLPKRRLSTRLLKISLSVAIAAVVFFGLSIFAIEFQSGLKEAEIALTDNLKTLASTFTREIQRRHGRVELLTSNPQALTAAVQSLRRSKNPELFFGPGVLYYQVLHQTQVESGGATNMEFGALSASPRHGILKVVELRDTEATAGILSEEHTMADNRLFSIRVLWNLSSILPEQHWSQGQFKGVAIVDDRGTILWSAGSWPIEEEKEAARNARRERMLAGHPWIEIGEELPIFQESLFLRAITPKSYLYAQAWRMSQKFLVRVFTLLAIGLCLVALLAVATRHVMKPLEDITRGVRRIAEGNLDTILETGGDDEIAFLAEQLNDMSHRLKVKEQSLQAHLRLLKEKNEELQKVSERLKEADRLKDHFLAVLSHELRTPLTAILGYSELSLDGIYGPLTEKQTEILSFIQANGNKLLSLMEDLLDIAKIRSGTIEVNAERFVLGDLMAGIRKFAENSIRQKDHLVRYEEELRSGLPEMHTDRVKLEQILTNILSNAIKFTERGAVRVSVSPADDGQVTFEVEDTGIGIAPQHLPRIFDAFVQLDAGIRRRYGGTGLGLTICKSLVEKLGGRISVESVLARGSRFTVTLPVEYKPVPAAAEVPAREGGIEA